MSVRKTRTSAFGSSGRQSHDSSDFYSGNLYNGFNGDAPEPEYVEANVPTHVLDHILLKSSERMDDLPDHSIHLMVTSPPYNVGKEYDDNLTLGEYRSLLSTVFSETYRVLVPGGRACVNIANLGRKPYIPVNGLITQVMIEAGFLMRGEIIWDKGSSSGSSTAWGSWQSPSNPTLRDVHEYIMVFSKGTFKREGLGRQATISRQEFLDYTKSIWSFGTESATRVGHPAPFPIELPYRLIQLYTYRDDVVLDPFMGSGTTALAAARTGRHFVGYEVDPDYVRLAEKRIHEFAIQIPLMDEAT